MAAVMGIGLVRQKSLRAFSGAKSGIRLSTPANCYALPWSAYAAPIARAVPIGQPTRAGSSCEHLSLRKLRYGDSSSKVLVLRLLRAVERKELIISRGVYADRSRLSRGLFAAPGSRWSRSGGSFHVQDLRCLGSVCVVCRVGKVTVL